MPHQQLHRRASTAAHAIFTGGPGEITIDTDKKTVVVHDGATAGGFPIARADQALATGNNLADLSNREMGRTNLGVYSKDESLSIGNPGKSRNGIYFNGASGQRLHASLGLYNIGSNAFSIRAVFRAP